MSSPTDLGVRDGRGEEHIIMTRWLLAAVAVVTASVLPFFVGAQSVPVGADDGRGGASGSGGGRWSKAYGSGTLAVVFWTGGDRVDAARYVPLFEALRDGTVVVHETGNVNRLAVENRGDRDVFVHQGDVVKGGKQDRVLATDLILPARSGRVDIDAFCVEQGRWAGRRGEKSDGFASAEENAASPRLRVAANANIGRPAGSTEGRGASAAGRDAQSRVWQEVSAAQEKLSRSAGGDVRPAASPSSYQLTVEGGKVAQMREAYVTELGTALAENPGATGVAFVVAGEIVSVDVYATPELLGSMYVRLLKGVAVAAAAEGEVKRTITLPTPGDFDAFVSVADGGMPETRDLPPRTRVLVRRGASGVLTETYDTRYPASRAVHRAVLAVGADRPVSDDAPPIVWEQRRRR